MHNEPLNSPEMRLVDDELNAYLSARIRTSGWLRYLRDVASLLIEITLIAVLVTFSTLTPLMFFRAWCLAAAGALVVGVAAEMWRARR